MTETGFDAACFRVFDNQAELAEAAANALFERISETVSKQGVCHVVLPGGSTPAACLQRLGALPLPWNAIHWYPGDERCLPPGHPERNDTMIEQTLFADPTRRRRSHFHPFAAESGARQAAASFARTTAAPRLDIAVLGMGEDGHIASLFPGNPALSLQETVVPVFDAPKAPAERVSFGMTALRQAKWRVILTAGESKRKVLSACRNGQRFPVTRFSPSVCFVDRLAMPEPA